MSADFEPALDFVLAREGAYVNNPKDPGGETNLGISRRQYPAENIRGMTRGRAAELYHRDFWLPGGCAALDQGPALGLFDSTVNLGVPRAVQLWRNAPGLDAFLWSRLDFYRQAVLRHPNELEFLPGWCRRLVLLYGATR